MNVKHTRIPGVLILEPTIYRDKRGFFFESYNVKTLESSAGIRARFVQDNHSMSYKGVLRGLHYQLRYPQEKLIRVVSGKVLDVAVDMRRRSEHYGQWTSAILSEENMRQIWIPTGFAHGFVVLSGKAEVLYKTTEFYNPEYERCIKWDDPDLAIDWQYHERPIISEKDANGVEFKDAEPFE